MAYTTIDKSTANFNTKLYTGTGSSNAVTGVGFSPGFVWLKKRSAADNHYLFDVVRGVAKYIRSNLNSGEATDTGSLSAFGSDGFTVVSEGDINANGATMASWNWKAGTSFSNSAGANGASLASTGSINTAAGFSIISYNGRDATDTIAHGLGAEPSVILFKCRSNAGSDWYSYWKPLGNNSTIRLNNTDGSGTTGLWNNTNPTSSVFTVISSDVINRVNRTFVAYCFAEKQGYSKFGSYTGNNNADGTFVHLGFKPAFVMTKMTNGAKSWMMYDNKRFPSNPINAYLTLNADSNAAEAYGPVYPIDFLSNGFKFRTDTSEVNGTENHIFMAFAENPFVTSTGVPTTAQ